MKISVMRKIDVIAGNCICLFLNVVERVRRLFTLRSERQKPQSILVIKYLGIGSLLFTIPALRALKKCYPACKVVLLTFEENRSFARIIPFFDGVVSVRTKNVAVFLKDTLSALIATRREQFDYVLDLEFFSRYSTIVSYLSGARCRVGYAIPQIWRGNLLHIPVHFDPSLHISRVFAAQVEALGVAVNDYNVGKLAVSESAVSRAAELLTFSGVPSHSSLIGVNINASTLSFERRWPRENFIRLIEAVTLRENVAILLIGLESERQYVTELYDALSVPARERTFNLAGRTDLELLLALFSLTTLFVTNDSGPLHIAAAMGAKTVSFFGPESPRLYGPQGEGHCVFYAGIQCSPCLNVLNAKRANCDGDNKCMRAITSEEVIETVFSVLDEG